MSRIQRRALKYSKIRCYNDVYRAAVFFRLVNPSFNKGLMTRIAVAAFDHGRRGYGSTMPAGIADGIMSLFHEELCAAGNVDGVVRLTATMGYCGGKSYSEALPQRYDRALCDAQHAQILYDIYKVVEKAYDIMKPLERVVFGDGTRIFAWVTRRNNRGQQAARRRG